jgi:Tfp pilus assembly protein PilX
MNMQTTMAPSRTPFAARCGFRRMAGVVLPVVLVVLTILTGLVVTQVRRNTIDERLAANARETLIIDGALQTALRYCEFRVTMRPRETQLAAGDGTLPAWNIGGNWADTSSLNFAAMNLVPGATLDPACVIENVTDELVSVTTGRSGRMENRVGVDPRFRKYRITARVRVAAPEMANGWREMMAQSDLRLYIDR